jgi:hypothetical protein
MTHHRPDPPLRVLRSLPLAILLATAISGIAMPFLHWLALLILPLAVPPGPVWLQFVGIRAAAGACVGAAMYVAGRLPHGWLRWCLYWTLLFLLIEGDMPDFTSSSLDRYLSVWAASSLATGVLVGTVFHLLERRNRTRALAERQPGGDPARLA